MRLAKKGGPTGTSHEKQKNLNPNRTPIIGTRITYIKHIGIKTKTAGDKIIALGQLEMTYKNN